MGLLDIFYSEANRWRDTKVSQEDKKKGIKEALIKTLKKFNFIWEDQMLTEIYPRDKIYPQIGIFSDEFLDLAVEVDFVLNDEKITKRLREVSTLFREVSKKPYTFGGYFENAIPMEMGQALNKINEIKDFLNEK